MTKEEDKYELSFTKIMIGKDSGEERFPVTFLKGLCKKSENAAVNNTEL
jgi:hypothetical protein